jgi:Ca2+-transporting ATPase
LGGTGLKILGLASKKISKNEIDNISIDNISGLNWEGMIGLWDPPRKEVRETMEIAREAGLDVKVVTGDYGKTAVKIMAISD